MIMKKLLALLLSLCLLLGCCAAFAEDADWTIADRQNGHPAFQ